MSQRPDAANGVYQRPQAAEVKTMRKAPGGEQGKGSGVEDQVSGKHTGF